MNQNLAKKGAKKTITFHTLQNTGYIKKNRFGCNLFFLLFFVLFNLFFLKLKKNIDVEQKT